MPANEHIQPELRIVLLGWRGEGKTSSGNTILGREVFDLRAADRSVKRLGEVAGRRITVVDTPGWLRNVPLDRTPELVKQNIVHSVFLCPPGPHAFLLIIRRDRSFSERHKQTVREHIGLFGNRVWRHTIVLFTYGDCPGRKTTEQHIGSEEYLQWVVEKCGNRYHVLSNKNRGDGSQVTGLLETVDDMVAERSGALYDISDFLHLPEIRIVLLGNRYAGKSSSGNTILDADEFDTNTAAQCEKKQGEVDSRQVIVVDTPGWWKHHDLKDTPEQVKQEIIRSVSICSPGPHTFLLVIRGYASFSDKDRKALENHVELLNEKVWDHAIVLFTHGDLLKGKTIEQHIESEANLQWVIQRCGNRYHVFDNNEIEDDTQARELLNKIEEMVAENYGELFASEINHNEECWLSMVVRKLSVLDAPARREVYPCLPAERDEKNMTASRPPGSSAFKKQKSQAVLAKSLKLDNITQPRKDTLLENLSTQEPEEDTSVKSCQRSGGGSMVDAASIAKSESSYKSREERDETHFRISPPEQSGTIDSIPPEKYEPTESIPPEQSGTIESIPPEKYEPTESIPPEQSETIESLPPEQPESDTIPPEQSEMIESIPPDISGENGAEFLSPRSSDLNSQASLPGEHEDDLATYLRDHGDIADNASVVDSCSESTEDTDETQMLSPVEKAEPLPADSDLQTMTGFELSSLTQPQNQPQDSSDLDSTQTSASESEEDIASVAESEPSSGLREEKEETQTMMSPTEQAANYESIFTRMSGEDANPLPFKSSELGSQTTLPGGFEEDVCLHPTQSSLGLTESPDCSPQTDSRSMAESESSLEYGEDQNETLMISRAEQAEGNESLLLTMSGEYRAYSLSLRSPEFGSETSLPGEPEDDSSLDPVGNVSTADTASIAESESSSESIEDREETPVRQVGTCEMNLQAPNMSGEDIAESGSERIMQCEPKSFYKTDSTLGSESRFTTDTGDTASTAETESDSESDDESVETHMMSPLEHTGAREWRTQSKSGETQSDSLSKKSSQFGSQTCLAGEEDYVMGLNPGSKRSSVSSASSKTEAESHSEPREDIDNAQLKTSPAEMNEWMPQTTSAGDGVDSLLSGNSEFSSQTAGEPEEGLTSLCTESAESSSQADTASIAESESGSEVREDRENAEMVSPAEQAKHCTLTPTDQSGGYRADSLSQRSSAFGSQTSLPREPEDALGFGPTLRAGSRSISDVASVSESESSSGSTEETDETHENISTVEKAELKFELIPPECAEEEADSLPVKSSVVGSQASLPAKPALDSTPSDMDQRHRGSSTANRAASKSSVGSTEAKNREVTMSSSKPEVGVFRSCLRDQWEKRAQTDSERLKQERERKQKSALNGLFKEWQCRLVVKNGPAPAVDRNKTDMSDFRKYVVKASGEEDVDGAHLVVRVKVAPPPKKVRRPTYLPPTRSLPGPKPARKHVKIVDVHFPLSWNQSWKSLKVPLHQQQGLEMDRKPFNTKSMDDGKYKPADWVSDSQLGSLKEWMETGNQVKHPSRFVDSTESQWEIVSQSKCWPKYPEIETFALPIWAGTWKTVMFVLRQKKEDWDQGWQEYNCEPSNKLLRILQLDEPVNFPTWENSWKSPQAVVKQDDKKTEKGRLKVTEIVDVFMPGWCQSWMSSGMKSANGQQGLKDWSSCWSYSLGPKWCKASLESHYHQHTMLMSKREETNKLLNSELTNDSTCSMEWVDSWKLSTPTIQLSKSCS